MPTVVAVVVIDFFLLRLAPGDAADALAAESGSATVETMAAMRHHFGLDQPVIDFLSGLAEVREMIDDISAYVHKWLPRFRADNRSYLTVAIGCTGGQHRSVYIAEALGALFVGDADVLVRHREMALADDGSHRPVAPG